MERFPKCWRNNPKCKWHMGFNHPTRKYLDGACYHNSDLKMFRCFDTREIKRIDLRPYFGMTSDDWPDGEDQYFVDYCTITYAANQTVKERQKLGNKLLK